MPFLTEQKKLTLKLVRKTLLGKRSKVKEYGHREQLKRDMVIWKTHHP